jgi:DNA-binding response OmpR family regulator
MAIAAHGVPFLRHELQIADHGSHGPAHRLGQIRNGALEVRFGSGIRYSRIIRGLGHVASMRLLGMSLLRSWYELRVKIDKVLIVEDDDDLRGLIRTVVEREGMATVEAADGREGLRQFYEHRPALVILDIGLPGLNGWQVLERIRELGDVPVLILTASSGELDKVRGLREGADDYVTKPFGRQELIARIEALLRRAGDSQVHDEVHSDGLIEIDFPQRRVTIRDRDLELTPTEFRLLAALVRHPSQVLSHDQLLEMAWGDPANRSHQQVKLYIGYLRRKLRDVADDDPIETVRGFGYRYRPDGP